MTYRLEQRRLGYPDNRWRITSQPRIMVELLNDAADPAGELQRILDGHVVQTVHFEFRAIHYGAPDKPAQ